MSTCRAIHSLRPFEISLVHGYFLITFSDHTPSDIINLCILYTYISDEFDKKTSTNANIKGLNHTIATLTSTTTNIPASISTRNSLKPSGKYHWSFQISNFENAHITFGFTQNNTHVSLYTLIPTKHWDEIDIFHVYLNADNQSATFKLEDDEDPPSVYQPSEFNENTHYKLCICVLQNAATINMISFDNSHWYQHISHPIHNIGYARCIADLNEKIKNYQIALRSFPFHSSWNNEYILCLIYLKQYNKAYDHILQYKKGFYAMSKLVGYFYSTDNYECTHRLLMLFDTEHLKLYDLFWESAYCSSKMGNKKRGLQLYEAYYEQHKYNDEMKSNVMSCISNIAMMYMQIGDYDNAIIQFFKLETEIIERKNLYGQIGLSYRKLRQFDDAFVYLQKYIDANPNDYWGYNQYSGCYDDQSDYENGWTFALKAMELAETDWAKSLTLTNIGTNCYYQGRLHDAIKFTKQALEIDNIPRADTVTERNNLGKYHYKIGKYEESFRYLSDVMKINPNIPDTMGNYGISLYYLNRIEEAVVYLEKCAAILNEVEDKELRFDVLYIYAKILFDEGKFIESIEYCLKGVESRYFDEYYKGKDNVYYLLSENYKGISKDDEAKEWLLKAKAFSAK